MSNQRLVAGVLFLMLAAPAAAETIEVYDNHGGSVVQYNKRWAGLAARGVNVKVVGPANRPAPCCLGISRAAGSA